MSDEISEDEQALEVSVRALLLPGVSASFRIPFHNGKRNESVRDRLRKQMAAQAGRPHDDIASAFASLIAEAALEGLDALRRAKVWSRLFFSLGLPASVLAAVAGVTALASTTGRVAAGIIALASAGLSAAVAFLDIDSRRQTNEKLAAAWQGLAERARFKLIEISRNPAWTTDDGSYAAFLTLNSARESLRRGVVPEV